MAQDSVEKIVIISAHCVMKETNSNGLEIREPTSKPVTDYVCIRLHTCASSQIHWKNDQNKRSKDTN
jgi:hypothetical protein